MEVFPGFSCRGAVLFDCYATATTAYRIGSRFCFKSKRKRSDEFPGFKRYEFLFKIFLRG